MPGLERFGRVTPFPFVLGIARDVVPVDGLPLAVDGFRIGLAWWAALTMTLG